ncbi:MAG: sulfotransferase family protein [Pseudomonadota bacterium]
MPLEVIGAGYGRTGTMSTYEALKTLGFPCYHMKEVFADVRQGTHLEFWTAVAEAPPGSQHDWERVFSEMCAAVDFPASCCWRELLEAYPNAKVLLTVHPGGATAWFDSAFETIYFTERYWQFRVVGTLVPAARRFARMCRRLIWERTLAGTMPDPAAAAARYDAHLAEVRAAVPAERLLEFDVRDGWEPLCAFLGVPVPPTPFPRINEREAFKRTIRTLRYGVNLALTVGVLLVAFAAWRLI